VSHAVIVTGVVVQLGTIARLVISHQLLSTQNNVVPDAFLHRMKFFAQDHSAVIVGFKSSIVRHAVDVWTIYG